jgi:hypothetical protein
MNFFCGIDPGFSGGIAATNDKGTWLRMWDMSVTRAGKKAYNVLDLPKLRGIFNEIKALPGVSVGLENPTTRPHEGAEVSFRFGRQLGNLESMLFCLGLEYTLISPQLWTGRMDLPGKDHAGWATARIDLFNERFPGRESMIRGPRGGLLDGRLDAALIAEFIRQKEYPVSDQLVRGSTEHLANVLSGRGKRRGQLPKFV